MIDQMRNTDVLRAIQAITAGVQAALGILAGTEVLSARVTVVVMAFIAMSQVGVATWNQGLHNEPTGGSTPKPGGGASDNATTVQLYPPGVVERGYGLGPGDSDSPGR